MTAAEVSQTKNKFIVRDPNQSKNLNPRKFFRQGKRKQQTNFERRKEVDEKKKTAIQQKIDQNNWAQQQSR